MIVRLVHRLLAGMGMTEDPASPSGSGKPLASAAVIVAHPDDEVLWAGGEILANPDRRWFIVALCRGSDPDRAPRFWRAIDQLDAMGNIADLDDGVDQAPLDIGEIQRTILARLPETSYDIVLTHAPDGEYTRHRRHEEVSRAVIDLWRGGRLSAGSMMLFAYEDGQGTCLPRPRENAHIRRRLTESIWERKRGIITGVYGFAPDSWEARTMPREEAFWQFDAPSSVADWCARQGIES